MKDDAHPGQAYCAITLVIAEIDGLIWENQQITEKEIRFVVRISHKLTCSSIVIITKHLHYQKICI